MGSQKEDLDTVPAPRPQCSRVAASDWIGPVKFRLDPYRLEAPVDRVARQVEEIVKIFLSYFVPF